MNPREQWFPDLGPDVGVLGEATASPLMAVAVVLAALILAALAIVAVTGER